MGRQTGMVLILEFILMVSSILSKYAPSNQNTQIVQSMQSPNNPDDALLFQVKYCTAGNLMGKF